MTLVTSAFEQFARALELTEAERDRASAQQNSLRDALRQTLGGVLSDRLIGSYARRTAIRPLHDIDVLVVLDPQLHADVRVADPTPCLRKMQRAIARIYPTKDTPDLQRRSVGISFSGTGIDYDLVPAFAAGEGTGVYTIPDRFGAGWIRTNPELHIARSTEANEHAAKKLKPVFKMLKHWRSVAGSSARSFHLEALSWGVFAGDPGRYPDALTALVGALAERLRYTCPDPAGVGPAVDASLTNENREREVRRFAGAADQMRKLLVMEAQGDVPRALAEWRRLLGEAFPMR
jgi:predicted nucleotidyltransferase